MVMRINDPRAKPAEYLITSMAFPLSSFPKHEAEAERRIVHVNLGSRYRWLIGKSTCSMHVHREERVYIRKSENDRPA
jgi:hypothetical protein